MRNMIGKGLVVATVAAACGYASAATITSSGTPGANYSLEGMNGSATSVFFNAVVTMGAPQAQYNTIQLSLSNNARFTSGAINVPSVSCTSGNIVLDGGTPAASSSTWDFQISSTSGTTSNVVCTFASLAIVAGSMTSAGTVAISSGVKRTSDTAYTFDTASAVTVLTVGSQIASVSVSTAFNGVVDYQNYSGLGFTTTDGTVGTVLNSDVLAINVVANNTQLSLTGNLSVNFVISAESGKTFAFLDDNGSCGTSAITNRTTSNGRVGTSAGALTINNACTQLTYSHQGVFGLGATTTLSVALGHKNTTPSTGVVIEPMVFPATNVVISQGATARNTTSINPGTWTSNGATAIIPYMPINMTAGTTQIDPVVTIANRSALTGTLTGSMRDEDGNSCTLSNLGTVGPTRTKNLGGLIKEAFAGCSNLSQTSTERLYISITATLPDSSTTFFSGYTVGGSSRVSVVNSTQGK
jgi:hypothetical protein